MKLELVSFSLCPFVQRAAILLKKKRAEFGIRYVDLENPPEWFDRISPMGQVPVLIVGETPIFESAVICEYLDETVAPSIHPRDSLQRARERAWVEFASHLLGLQYQSLLAETGEEKKAKTDELFSDLARFEPVVSGRFFRGSEFGFVDAAMAPLFVRMFLARRLRDDARWEAMPKVRRWAESLLPLPEVQESVNPGFDEEYRTFLREHGEAA